MDKFTKEKMSAIMRAIRSSDTQPELIVRKWLYAHGWRFRCQYKRVPGAFRMKKRIGLGCNENKFMYN